MPPARRRPKPKAKPRARRSAPQWRASLPTLEQRHFDVIGLALVAAAIFFAFVVYLGWDGGQAGDGAVQGLRILIGAVHYLVPVALMAAGAILVLRPVLPAVRPFKAGAVCLFAALTLALFLFIAAVLLLTGASIAGVVKATSDSISTTTREVRTAVQRRRPARRSFPRSRWARRRARARSPARCPRRTRRSPTSSATP